MLPWKSVTVPEIEWRENFPQLILMRGLWVIREQYFTSKNILAINTRSHLIAHFLVIPGIGQRHPSNVKVPDLHSMYSMVRM